VHSWLGVITQYQLAGTQDEPQLTVTVSIARDYQPVTSHPDRYRLIRSQLDEPGLTVVLLSALDPDLVLPSVGGLAALRRYRRALHRSIVTDDDAAPGRRPHAVAAAGRLTASAGKALRCGRRPCARTGKSWASQTEIRAQDRPV
jgi:hypothetical protein